MEARTKVRIHGTIKLRSERRDEPQKRMKTVMKEKRTHVGRLTRRGRMSVSLPCLINAKTDAMA